MSEFNNMKSSPTTMTPVAPSFSRPIDQTLSYFEKTVSLQSWWLIKAEKDFDGRRLGVAGLTSRGNQPVRVFKSAPILKRHDIFTLETVDGVLILMEGYINQDRTNENGFPSEVFNHFVFGFPPLWEEYAEKWCGKEPTVEDASMNQIPGKISTDPVETSSLEDASEKSTFSFKERDISRSQDNSHDLSSSAVNPSGSASAGQASLEELSLAKKALEDNTFMSNAPNKILEVENTNYSSLFVAETELPGVPVAEEELPGAPVVAEKELPGAHIEAEKELAGAPVVSEKEALGAPVVLEKELPGAPEKVDNHKQPILTTNATGKKKKVQLDGEANGLSEDRIKKTPRSSVRFVDTKGTLDSDTVVKEKGKYASNSVISLKKTKRKLRYETPLTPKGTCIPPGSSSPKRSRSGRLLLPSMEFWRNQMAIYDESRTIIGVKDDVNEKKFGRGSVSEPPPRKRK